MNPARLQEILDDHVRWLCGQGGSRADLADAELERAELERADLRGADLRDAYLTDAYLTRADLRGANLRGANLARADLTGADLRGADLTRAHLADADLTDANLTDANLDPIRDDMRAVLDAAPNEVPGLLEALRAGKIEGSTYEGECACLVGTIANVRHCRHTELDGLEPDASRPIERFFLGIGKGDTPLSSQFAKIAESWIVEWLDEHAGENQ